MTLARAVINYKSDLKTRLFFERHLPEFTGFSALVQKQIKQRLANGEQFTYRDAIEMHRTFLKDKAALKATNQATVVAHNSCQYNQFSIDYKYDVNPKLHSLSEAWQLVRNSAGAKTYQQYKEAIDKIRGIIEEKIKHQIKY